MVVTAVEFSITPYDVTEVEIVGAVFALGSGAELPPPPPPPQLKMKPTAIK